MDVSLNNIEYCKINAKCVSTKEEAEDKLNEIIRDFKKLPVKGFRKNKPVPQAAIYTQYRKQINEAVRLSLLQESFDYILFEAGVKSFGPPKINSSSFDGNEFKCDLTFNHKPNVELTEYKNLKFDKINLPTIDDHKYYVENLLRVRKGIQETIPPTNPLLKDDIIIASHKTYIDGVLQEALCGYNMTFQLGNIPTPGWDYHLIDSTFEEPIVFSVIAEGGLYKGKEVKFEITVSTAIRKLPADLTDTLFESYNCKNLDEWNEFVLAETQKNLNDLFLTKATAIYENKLLSLYDFEVPKAMIDNEIIFVSRSLNLQFNQLPKQEQDMLVEQAKNSVKSSIILEAIRAVEPDTQLSYQESQKLLQEWVRISNITKQSIIDDMVKSGELELIRERLINRHSIEVMTKTCTFE